MEKTVSLRFCGKDFSALEMESIRELIRQNPDDSREAIARKVCEMMNWKRPDGRLKTMTCKVALLRMFRAGHIILPLPRHKHGNGNVIPQLTSLTDPQAVIEKPLKQLLPLTLERVNSANQSRLWNEYIHRYHYLGYKPIPGAQIRYLVYSKGNVLAALSFGASAWNVKPREEWIGWTEEKRKNNLHLIINNSRFLILPWVKVKYLASHILSLCAKQIPEDWKHLYQYSPMLLETFVEKDRFKGTCYKAANWFYIGQTKGRGKLEKKNIQAVPIKDIYLFPLEKNFRTYLMH